MKSIWEQRGLELITWFVFAVLVTTSTLILYTSYSDYHEIITSVQGIEKSYEHKIIMLVSAIVLLLSLLIMWLKRDYFFLATTDNIGALEKLLEDIKLSSDNKKVEQFKLMLNQRDHTEIYPLISNMINELQESKRLADEANSTKSIFLSNISHEIRTPLNGVMGFTKLLKSTKLDSEQLEFVKTIRKSSEDLIGIVDDILDISKIESGRIEFEKVYFNIIDEFENVIETYAVEASKKEIEFSLWIDPAFAFLYVQSDYKKIKQVLINLISNAIKFTPYGGKINVVIEKSEIKEGQVSVQFTVHDTGIGISDEQKERVFDAFTQGDSSSIRQYGGTGLGLTIATRLVRVLGGVLELKSELGQGSRLSFSLEMAQKKMNKEYRIKTLRVALYTPTTLQSKNSDIYLEKYLTSFKEVKLQRFRTFIECKDALSHSFDVLYIHCNEIDKAELKRIVAQHSAESQIVLVTTLKRRDEILDIAPIFTQVFYEPIGFTKVLNSIERVSENREELKEDQSQMFYGLKSLVVEDNPINQKLIIRTLENLGIYSDGADNGKIGVEMYMKNQYDIIFMDIQMPIMNGVSATKAIIKYEKENNLAHTPIVAVTTNTLKGDRERYLSEGMDEYIPKPIDLNKFISVLKQFYSTSRVQSETTKRMNRDILLYKEKPIEAKIMSSILKRLDYSVDVVNNIAEFKRMMNIHQYKTTLIDRSESDILHRSFSDKIKEKQIPSLLFIDKGMTLHADEEQTYGYIIDKLSDFSHIKERIDALLE